jgi:hypothetical protein
MPTDAEKVVDGFPHPTIAPNNGVPNYETISTLNLQLNANAASVQSNLGDGLLGFLYLTITPAEYNALSATELFPPENPGASPNVPYAATDSQVATLIREHKTETQLFKEYIATDKALKQQVIAAVDSMYLKTLRNRITGLATVTTLEMLTHLYTSYGRLTPADLQDNDTCFRKPYDPNQPIEALFDQIEDAVSLADAAQAPYSAAQIVAIAYTLVFATGMLPEACREWRRNPAKYSWPNFKTFFAEGHQDLRDSQLTSKQSGYHDVNTVLNNADNSLLDQHNTAEAIANLATATASNRTTVANLSATNSALTAELTQANNKLNLAHSVAAALKIELATLCATRNNDHHTTPANSARTYQANNNYCWMHGYKVNGRHTSTSCLKPATGHQHDATKDNNKGGSQRGKE